MNSSPLDRSPMRRTAVPVSETSTWWETTRSSIATPTTPVPPARAHSSCSCSAASPRAPAKAVEASTTSPVCHCHAPQGTDHHDTPKTRSTGSHPIEWRRSVSSMERLGRGPGGPVAAALAPSEGRHGLLHLLLAVGHTSRTTGSGSGKGS